MMLVRIYEKGPLTWENGACDSSRIPTRRALSQSGSSHTLDQLDICFDDTHAIANAGLLLAATLAERLGILVHSMLAGADCIDDATC